ncbi:MAG TPA: hypothetical protein VFB12_13045 [Ktedonobacteraceae bacterium]|nr:hypothetical protein [Ktedonobacteraceae bacterium]
MKARNWSFGLAAVIGLVLICTGCLDANGTQGWKPPNQSIATQGATAKSTPGVAAKSTPGAAAKSTQETPAKSTPGAKVKATTVYTPIALAPSVTPSQSLPSNSSQWTTAETFTGNGVKKTVAFTVPKSWRIVWGCDLASHSNQNYDLIIHVNTTSNTLLADSVETTCRKSNTNGLTVMHQAGQVYLNVISEGNWTVMVQYMK